MPTMGNQLFCLPGRGANWHTLRAVPALNRSSNIKLDTSFQALVLVTYSSACGRGCEKGLIMGKQWRNQEVAPERQVGYASPFRFLHP